MRAESGKMHGRVTTYGSKTEYECTTTNLPLQNL